MPVTPQLILRADGGTRIGNGHLMRCLALATEWRQTGGEAIFITHADSSALKDQICAARHSLRCLPFAHPHSCDLEATLSAARCCGASWVVLDGYHFDQRYQAEIRQAGLRLLVIDDNAHMSRYEADIVLNQNLHASELHYDCAPTTRLLLGPRYALLRPEFAAYAHEARTRPITANRLLVTMGGSDAHNVSAKVIQALNRMSSTPFDTRIVVGPGNPHLRELEVLLQTSKVRIELVTATQQGAVPSHHRPSPTMAELIDWADIAISAAGSTCWEMACLGLPALLIVTADNQSRIAGSLDQAGAAINLGEHAKVTPAFIADACESLRHDWRCRQRMSEIGQRLVDGKGARRVSEILLSIPSSTDDRT